MKNMLGIAIALASEVFKNKVDKGGKPYILHCLRVMNAVDQDDEELMQIAILHDVPEDIEEYRDFVKLRELGFSQRVISALILLTHDRENISYEDYIKLISTNKDAIKVKKNDLRDNSDITRIKGLRKKDHERIEKYHKAYTYLS